MSLFSDFSQAAISRSSIVLATGENFAPWTTLKNLFPNFLPAILKIKNFEKRQFALERNFHIKEVNETRFVREWIFIANQSQAKN